jgi:hypothetical protein
MFGGYNGDMQVILEDGKTKFIKDLKIGDILLDAESRSNTVIRVMNSLVGNIYNVETRDTHKIMRLSDNCTLVLKLIKHPQIIWDEVKNGWKLVWSQSHEISIKFFEYKITDENNREAYKRAALFLAEVKKNKDFNRIGEIVEMKLSEYINKDALWKSFYKTFRSNKINFSSPKSIEIPIHPYLLGYWLGDIESSMGTITIDNNDIKEKIGSMIGIERVENNLYRFDKVSNNRFHIFLRKNHLLKEKHVPIDYRISSIENRMLLLEGFLDANSIYEHQFGLYHLFIQNNELYESMLFIIKSLGIKFSEMEYKTKTLRTRRGIKTVVVYNFIIYFTKNQNEFNRREPIVELNINRQYSKNGLYWGVFLERSTFLNNDFIVLKNSNKFI